MERAARPSGLAIWVLAARPRTLSAAVVPVMAGTAAAAAEGAFSPLAAAAALAGSLAVQILANFSNDYFDAKKGADRDRQGPLRVMQSGLVTEGQMRAAIAAAIGFAVLCGIYLVAVGGIPIAVIGIASILAGLAYTGGPFPLGYHGLGDVFVFVFFGLVAVAGTYYVQALRWSQSILWIATPVGLMTTAILVVNNLRDAPRDRAAGKLTLVARFGRRFGRWEYALLLLFSYAVPVFLAAGRRTGPGVLLTWLSLPLAIRTARRAFSDPEAPSFNRALAATSQLVLVYGLLLSAGLLLGAP